MAIGVKLMGKSIMCLLCRGEVGCGLFILCV